MSALQSSLIISRHFSHLFLTSSQTFNLQPAYSQSLPVVATTGRRLVASSGFALTLNGSPEPPSSQSSFITTSWRNLVKTDHPSSIPKCYPCPDLTYSSPELLTFNLQLLTRRLRPSSNHHSSLLTTLFKSLNPQITKSLNSQFPILTNDRCLTPDQ